ncbi:hypothetical protein GOODEAATRI_033173 [Goodea atripinnis]|uniref:Uncharacterized protein n=1 Tax=Goodea atripinnis TaxID=208336 RepID=A0ABV0Q3X8_9TELE
MEDFFTCRDLSVSPCMMPCPVLHLLLHHKSLPRRLPASVTVFFSNAEETTQTIFTLLHTDRIFTKTHTHMQAHNVFTPNIEDHMEEISFLVHANPKLCVVY